MLTGLSLFTGGGGADIGLKDAGINMIGGIEYDSEIANVARLNGIEVTIADILECDANLFPGVDFLHASPPCPNFSIAKAGAKETEYDKALARKVSEFIEVMKPKYFTLENVYKYRKSESWAIIRDTLYKLGYGFSLDHVNFADLGVPQTRKRMIVRAIRGLGCFMPPPLLKPVKWVGWYEAVKDLVRTFEDDKFADWQLKRMPDDIKEHLLISRCHGGSEVQGTRNGLMPAFTITSNTGGHKAFIVSGGASNFIADGTSNDYGKSMTIVNGNMPAFTITASIEKRPTRGFINGRIVRLSTRALARFQAFPDWYQLPKGVNLAGKIIGNAVPCLGMQRIAESFINEVVPA